MGLKKDYFLSLVQIALGKYYQLFWSDDKRCQVHSFLPSIKFIIILVIGVRCHFVGTKRLFRESILLATMLNDRHLPSRIDVMLGICSIKEYDQLDDPSPNLIKNAWSCGSSDDLLIK